MVSEVVLTYFIRLHRNAAQKTTKMSWFDWGLRLGALIGWSRMPTG